MYFWRFFKEFTNLQFLLLPKYTDALLLAHHTIVLNLFIFMFSQPSRACKRYIVLDLSTSLLNENISQSTSKNKEQKIHIR